MVSFAEFLAVEAALDRRWPETAMEPSTDRIAALVDALGEPQRSYPVVHLTGTNGKTSTARMIDALLTEVGLRTGRYTSPHLQRATERINVDNRPVTPERYVELYREVAPFVDIVDASHGALSKFEVLTAMGFAAFADAPVEAAVIEVGLGGRWDATNVADGAVAVITPIGLDHAEYLGTDVLGIAEEKSGIIKPGAVAVIAEQDPAVAQVLLERCVEVEAQVARQGAEFGVESREIAIGGQRLALRGLSGTVDEIFLPLHGEHQAGNAALALAAVEALIGAGPQQPIDPDAVRAGFAAVRSPGRLERVASGAASASTVFIDAAHNPHGARALAATLTAEFRFTRLVGVLGVMREKDAARHPRRAGAGAGRGGRHRQHVAAGDGPRRAGRGGGGGLRRRPGERVAHPVDGHRGGPGAGRGGRRVRRRRDRHGVGRHGGGDAHAVRAGAGVSEEPTVGRQPAPRRPHPTR